MAQAKGSLTLVESGRATEEIGDEALQRLFEAFISCRTTLDDLSSRAALLGESLSGPVIAAYLTGRSHISDQKHDAIAAAINARLSELSLPAAAPTRATSQSPDDVIRDGAS